MQGDRAAVDRPVGIALDNHTVGMPGKRAAAGVIDARQRLAHDGGVIGGGGDRAAVAGWIAEANGGRHRYGASLKLSVLIFFGLLLSGLGVTAVMVASSLRRRFTVRLAFFW